MDISFLLLQVCFFVSGFAALLYETAWTRELASVFGTSELAISAVLAAYMGGLALGAALIARWAPQIKRPILVYGLLELGIALGALWVPYVIRVLSSLYVHWLGGLDAPPGQIGLMTSLFHLGGTFLVLLPCTTLMGATLPLLARYAVRHKGEIGPRIGLLYSVNTGGAIFGALAAAFFLLPSLGLRQTIYCGAVANTLVFLAATGLSRISTPSSPASDSAGEYPPGNLSKPPAILLLISISGMVSFMYEVLWVRILGFILGGSTAAFASMLSSFLLGIALGSAIASRLARTTRGAAVGFAVAQLGTAFFAALSFGLADQIPALATAFGASLSNLGPGAFIAVLVLLPTTLCIGATFPFAVKIYARGVDDAAPASARVYAWNTVGSIAGSIGAGFFLLPLIGFEGTLAVGVLLNLALAIATATLLGQGRTARNLAALALAGAGVFLLMRPGPPLMMLSRSTLIGGQTDGELEYLGVGRSATVALTKTAFARRLATNGLPEASIEGPGAPMDRFHDSRWLGLVPVLARPNTEQVLLIGLGGGNTLGAIPRSVDSVEVIELEPEVVRANQIIGADRRDGSPLDDPRLTLRIGDARGALMLSGRKYDAIISQPSHPWTSGASHLYTREFFSMVSDRLDDDGVFVQWMGLGFLNSELLRNLVGSLTDEFEYVAVISPGTVVSTASMIFVASDSPLPLLESTPEALAVAGEELSRVGIHSVEDVAASLVLDSESAREFSSGRKRITDDHNHLAWAASQARARWRQIEPYHDAIAPYDILPRLAQDLDSDLIVRRLVQRGSNKRARIVAESLGGAQEKSALGWIALEAGQLRSAKTFFEDALERDPSNRGALIGRTLLTPPGESLGQADPRAAAIVKGLRLRQSGDWEELSLLDPDLAQWEPGSLLFPEAIRLRIAWRNAQPELERGEKDLALALADSILTRGRQASDHLLRAQAAQRLGLDLHAWASLDRITQQLRNSRNARALAIGSLKVAAQLDPIEGTERTVEILRHGAARPGKPNLRN